MNEGTTELERLPLVPLTPVSEGQPQEKMMPTQDNPQAQTEQMFQVPDEPDLNAARENVLEAQRELDAVQKAIDAAEAVDRRSAQEKSKADFVAKLLASRNQPPVNIVPAGATTERQLTQTQLEMEAGRRAVAKHAARDAAVKEIPRVVDPKEGTTVPVFRPADYVHEKGSAGKGLSTSDAPVR